MNKVRHKFGTRQSIAFSQADWIAHTQFESALRMVVAATALNIDVPTVCIPDRKRLADTLNKTNLFFEYTFALYAAYHQTESLLHSEFDVDMWFQTTDHGTYIARLGVDDSEYESHVLHSHLDACTWLLKSLYSHITANSP